MVDYSHMPCGSAYMIEINKRAGEYNLFAVNAKNDWVPCPSPQRKNEAALTGFVLFSMVGRISFQ